MFSNDIFLCAKIDDTQSLLEVIIDLDPNQCDEENESLLHYTVKFNSLEFARILLSHNANPNIQNSNGDTPLMIACKMGKLDFIRLLLRFDADINKTNNYGETALHMAMLNGNLDIIKLLINEKSNTKAITESHKSIAHYAVKSGRLAVLRYIVEKCDSDINERDGLGNTLLHYAASINNFDIIQYLLKMNASLHIRNNQGETPLFEAVRYSSLNVVDYLIMSGAIASVVNIFDESVKDAARDDIKQYLDSLDFNYEYNNRINSYPLHIAVLKLDYLDAKKYIEFGHKNNKRDNYGKTPIEYAMDMKDDKMLKILCSKK